MRALVVSFFIIVLSFSLFSNSKTEEKHNRSVDKGVDIELEQAAELRQDTIITEDYQYVFLGQLEVNPTNYFYVNSNNSEY